MDYYQKTYQRWYNLFSKVYDPFMRLFCFLFNGGFGGKQRFHELIIKWIDPQPGDKIIDICCGTATLVMMLYEKLNGIGEITGIEISFAQLRIARKKQKHERPFIIQGDARYAPFADNYFNKSVICGALHEMPQEVRSTVLSEAYRITMPGGKITILEHNKPNKKWKAWLFDLMERVNPEYATYKSLLKSGLINEIEQANFKIIKTDTIFREFFQIVLAKK
ncbi:MAG: hypothetical protein DRP26_04215 [Candidatus Zixiibacteriota bacterium]|nr:MAG: hypothetical protein DRP26_04215 [candidate division Zixibacteria bacterium]